MPTSGTTQTLYGVAFADASHGWAVGGGGTILRTTNGGGTWIRGEVGDDADAVRLLVFADAPPTLRAVGAGGTILRTATAAAPGAVNSGTTQTLHGVAFVDAIHGWAVGGKATVVHTTDGSGPGLDRPASRRTSRCAR